MLVHPGDLIPVREEAVHIPWTKRKSQILNYLHRGPVTFQTYVYDTNVGDISSLATYFNPQRWNENDLNDKFGYKSASDEVLITAVAEGGNNNSTEQRSKSTSEGSGNENTSTSALPRLLLYLDSDESMSGETDEAAEINSLSEKEKQTIQWVIRQNASKSLKRCAPAPAIHRSASSTSVDWMEGAKKRKGLSGVEEIMPSLADEDPSSSPNDDVFLPWGDEEKRKPIMNMGPVHEDVLRISAFKPDELRRPSDVWRLGSDGILSPFINQGNSFWNWDGGSKVSSFSDSSWQENSRSTGWSSGSNSVVGSTENLNKPNKSREDFLLGESLLQNLTNFARNETLV